MAGAEKLEGFSCAVRHPGGKPCSIDDHTEATAARLDAEASTASATEDGKFETSAAEVGNVLPATAAETPSVVTTTDTTLSDNDAPAASPVASRCRSLGSSCLHSLESKGFKDLM